MADVRNQQEVTVSVMDDTVGGANLEAPYMDDGPSAEPRNASGELAASESNESTPAFSRCFDGSTDTVPRAAGNLINEIEEFIPGVRRYYENILGRQLLADTAELFNQLFSDWNTFLQPVQGIRGPSAIISSDINEDINEFIRQEEQQGGQWTADNKRWDKRWLPRWNMFLQARAGETLVTCLNVCLTIVGFMFYIVDLVSDIGTSMYYASNGQWWRAVVTLSIVYGAVIIHTGWKWRGGQIHCTGAADWLRYVASSLLNLPNVKQYWTLCVLEWKLYKSPASSARLVPEWQHWRLNVAYLKFTEGVCEACPQAILQLYLLVPDLYGDWTWTDYLRIAGTLVSLCTAGAALVNREKYSRIYNKNDVPVSELVVLHVWVVPVTVSRLLSVALLLSVHPYWALAGVALHLVLPGISWCVLNGVPCSLTDVIALWLDIVLFFISPFDVVRSITYEHIRHIYHFLVNTAVTVVWARGTPLVCSHPALYTAIICFNAVMFVVGLVGWQLHKKYFRRKL